MIHSRKVGKVTGVSTKLLITQRQMTSTCSSLKCESFAWRSNNLMWVNEVNIWWNGSSCKVHNDSTCQIIVFKRCNSEKPGRQDMTEFIQLGNSGQDCLSIMHHWAEEWKQTHYQTVWLTDWLHGHVENQHLIQHWETDWWETCIKHPMLCVCWGLLYDLFCGDLLTTFNVKPQFPTVWHHINASKYQTRWIRKLFVHVWNIIIDMFCLVGIFPPKSDLFFFIKVPQSDYPIPEAHLHSAEHFMARDTANTANAADEWQMSFVKKKIKLV